ncbi:8-oxo-dGTP diphosphatase [Solibacillus kalamii]|uniref:DNA mismatch repair protein MutT n=1 Tax=Solibacillus kalamii TaxID=1748298 RepID=A0ABX3ZFU4_9BACL|nr:NUDIX hydrolase [Solibacillus kalamii]MBM7666089.1 8-oxo-dGTP diphosphatase [Solibacillus kalamii]OUZ38590.1 DNA mismatch repair protein MutT [Solibacillus kalamii]
MIITKNNGFQFLEFLFVKETEIYNYHRLAGSYAVIKCDDKYLLCYNTLRNQWELPAGQRETNETPKDCAIRELYEETGQRVLNIEFKGLLKVKNVIKDEIKYNPVYFATLEKLQPFQKNNETSEIQLWDLEQKIGHIDEVDLKIFDFIK